MSRNKESPLKGIDTLLLVHRYANGTVGRNKESPLKGIDTPSPIPQAPLMSRRNKESPLKGIDTFNTVPRSNMYGL